jgi:hypothetical protein
MAQQAVGGKLMRTIGLVMARVKIGLSRQPGHSMRRLVWLVGQAA